MKSIKGAFAISIAFSLVTPAFSAANAPLLVRTTDDGFWSSNPYVECAIFSDRVVVSEIPKDNSLLNIISEKPLVIEGLEKLIDEASTGNISVDWSVGTDLPMRAYVGLKVQADQDIQIVDLGGYEGQIQTVNDSPAAKILKDILDQHCPKNNTTAPTHPPVTGGQTLEPPTQRISNSIW